jgi:HAD domain in Swiss Army Knife RNA repair proteins
MHSKEPLGSREEIDSPNLGADDPRRAKPLLMVDIDGVISLFGVSIQHSSDPRLGEGSFHSIEGIPHFLSAIAAAHLLELSGLFELVWASGWEERADDHLPHLLGLPQGLPFLRFSRSVGRSNAHWKLAAIDAHAAGRPLAWIDDALNDECRAWAEARPAPTLLVRTEPELGLTARESQLLRDWAARLPGLLRLG